jgi:hypothetical protein
MKSAKIQKYKVQPVTLFAQNPQQAAHRQVELPATIVPLNGCLQTEKITIEPV